MAWVTTLEASRLTGLSDSRIRQLLGKGLIKGRKMGPIWLVSSASLQKYISLDVKPGPKPKERLRKTEP